MAAHSPSTPVIQPVLPDQAPSAWPSWLREIAGAVNTLGAKTTELAAVPPGSGPAGPPGPTGPAGPPGATGSPGPPGSANMAGMTAGQIPIAASATSVISSANLSGDITSNAVLATTLATVNATVGTFQGLTVNGKGLVVAAVDQGYALLAGGTLSTSASYAFPADGSANPYWLTGQLWQQTNPVNPPTTTNTHQQSTMAILRHTPGAGVYSPSLGDAALILGCDKLNYMTSTVDGEIDTLWLYNEQGRKGDSATLVANVTRVDDPAFPNYGSLFFESAVTSVNSSGVILKALHTLSGQVITSPTSVDTPATVGHAVDARQGVNGVGYLVDTLDESGGSNPPSWQHAFMARTGRLNSNIYFDVTPNSVTLKSQGTPPQAANINIDTPGGSSNSTLNFRSAGTNKIAVLYDGASTNFYIYDPATGNLPFQYVTSGGNVGNLSLGVAAKTVTLNGNVGIGTPGAARLTVGTPLTGAAASTTVVASGGALSSTINSDVNIASFGVTATNAVSLGIHANRVSAGSDWTTTAIALGMDVDGSTRIGGNLWLTANGRVGVSTSAPLFRFGVECAGAAAAADFIATFRNTHATANDGVILVGGGPNSADTTTGLISFYDAGVATSQGKISRNGAAAVAYGTSSDERLKENISDTSLGLEELLQLKVRDYNFKMDPRQEHGLIAQEVAAVYPMAVCQGGDDPLKDPWMIDYGRLTPLLIKSIQQQQTVIAALQQRLAVLEAR